jgi:hypothetical protein
MANLLRRGWLPRVDDACLFPVLCLVTLWWQPEIGLDDSTLQKLAVLRNRVFYLLLGEHICDFKVAFLLKYPA